jgi:HlyD family secretion protein
MQFTHWQPASPSGLRRRLFLLAASVSMVLLGTVSGCNRPSAASPEQGAAPKTPEVKVVRPEKKDVRHPIERPGFNIEAYEHTPLYAKVAGFVGKWNFDIGAHVEKDDVLAEVSIPEMVVELSQKEAVVLQVTAEIEQAKAALERSRAEYDRAQSRYNRLARVGRGGAIDDEAVDESRYGSRASEAGVAKAVADVKVAEARLVVAKADREHTQTLLQYTKIRAPFKGRVTQRHVNTGDFVQPSANGKGESLFVVEKVDPVRVIVNVQEQEAVWVRDGDTALIRPQSLQGQQFKGTVTRSSGALNPQNRTLRTEIDLPNGDGKLLPGMYVTATIIAEHKNVWALPVAAVVTQGEQTFCYRVENGKAVRTAIQIGLRGDGQFVEVVNWQKPGSPPTWEPFTGNEVVATKAAGLSDGQAVQTEGTP